MGTMLAQGKTVAGGRAAMLALPVRLDLIEAAARAMSLRELDLEVDAFMARPRRVRPIRF